MSIEDGKEWFTTTEIIASEYPFAPRSQAAVSRLVTRLRFEAPAKLKRAGRQRFILVHVSALDPEREPPAELHDPSYSRASGKLCHKILNRLPPRRDGSRPTFDQGKAALVLLGYRA